MSQDVLELVQGMDLQDIEMQIAFQCAPLIAGLKLSNLLMIQNTDTGKVKQILRRTGISYYIVAVTDEKTAVLLYNRQQLEDYLAEKKVQQLLLEMGYQELTLSEVLSCFRVRYQGYMEDSREFPHEMGLLLGYPIEDVRGFIQNEGENCLYTGYWKVYENLSEKVVLFRKFENARETLIQMLSSGMGLVEIIQNYSLIQNGCIS